MHSGYDTTIQQINEPNGKLCSRAHCADAILSESGSTDVNIAYLSQKIVL